MADPTVLAAQEGLANTMDAEPMIAALVATGGAPRFEAESLVPFRKFLGEKVVQDVIEPPAQEGGYGTRSKITRTISNTTTHPGKTFYGCAYRFEILDENGEPL